MVTVEHSDELPKEDLETLGDPAELLRVINQFHDLIHSGLWAEKSRPEISVGAVVIPERPASEGLLVRSTSLVWAAIVAELGRDWERAYTVPWRVWEEIVAGAYKNAGYDEVILTSRSADHGRDVIAIKKGVGSVRILGSIKAYRPGRLVTKEEVHALLGVVTIDPNASKGIFTTTSDFAPRIMEDPRLAASVPHRLELMNGVRLRQWLKELLEKP